MGQTLTVTLPEIYPKLTLANFEGAQAEIEIVDPPEYDHIINISGIDLTSEKIEVTNIDFDDTDDLTYEEFKNTMTNLAELIKNSVKNDRWIMVNCMAGSNRSVSAIISYAIYEGWQMDDVVAYIGRRKSETGNAYWKTLGSQILQKYLRRLQDELNNSLRNQG